MYILKHIETCARQTASNIFLFSKVTVISIKFVINMSAAKYFYITHILARHKELVKSLWQLAFFSLSKSEDRPSHHIKNESI